MKTVYRIENVPSDTQMREILDPLVSSAPNRTIISICFPQSSVLRAKAA